MPAEPAAGAAPANQQTVRQHNRALVLRAVADQPGRTRAQLAVDIGLTRATVSALVDELIRARLLVEREPTPGLRGRPGSRLALDPSGAAVVGLEIDVDRTSACVLDLTGAVRDRRVLDVDNAASAPAIGLRRAARLVGELTPHRPVTAVAMAFPGLVTPSGVVRTAPNLPRWQGLDPSARLGALLAAPVVSVGNEANLAALAEYWYGTRLADFVQVSGEIGVGGGVVVGGRLFRGVRGFAGEIGHLPVDPCGPRCGCGNRGCLEQVAGRRAVLTAAQAHDEAELRWRAEAGDARTLGAFAETSRALAIALSAVVNTLDLPAVVLSGFYARVAPWLVEHLTAELNERVVSRAPVDVHVSDLGADAPMLGAAGQVIRRIIGTGALPLVGTPVV